MDILIILTESTSLISPEYFENTFRQTVVTIGFCLEKCIWFAVFRCETTY